jgi:hypothetical protein
MHLDVGRQNNAGEVIEIAVIAAHKLKYKRV